MIPMIAISGISFPYIINFITLPLHYNKKEAHLFVVV